MSLFHFHEGLFDLPGGWRDQTMNVLRLPGQHGKKDAAILVTRDAETPLDDPGEYADAQQEAAKKNFPGYKPIAREAFTLDGQPAVMVDYQWRSNGSIWLRQRQAYVRHRDSMLILTLSGKHDEFALLEDPWQQVLSTLKLLTRETEIQTPGSTPRTAGTLPHIIAMATRRHVLQVFPDLPSVYRRMDPFQVEDQHWVFFASDGTPLKVNFTLPNRRGWFRSRPGCFELQPDVIGVARPLRERLRGEHKVHGIAPLDTLDAIRAHLGLVDPAISMPEAEASGTPERQAFRAPDEHEPSPPFSKEEAATEAETRSETRS